MMKRTLLSCLMLGLAACASEPKSDAGFSGGWVLYPALRPAPQLAPGCPPTGWARERLDGLKVAKFEIADEAKRQAFAKAIVSCLASPDPEIRDGIAYESLTHMLREKQLSDETKRALLVDLTARLKGEDPLGFARPFAALALSEVARADRVEAFLTEDERVKLLVEAQHWFINIKDYRGFDDAEGWRHGVAHGADLLMQLALNPHVDAEGLRLIVSAVAVQVAPKGVSYVDGESERLARPVLFAAARGALTEAEWTAWLGALAKPPEGVDVFGSEAGLAWRHDTVAFLQALYVNVTLGSDKADDVMLPGLATALRAMP